MFLVSMLYCNVVHYIQYLMVFDGEGWFLVVNAGV